MADVVEKELELWLTNKNRVVLTGIGNPIRTDDYVGLKIVESLKGKMPSTVLLLEAETVPESYLQEIEDFQPSHVLLIDAAFLHLQPGEVSLLDVEQIANYSATTTHLLPLRIFCDYIKQVTNSKIALLLVEPKNMEFGEGLTTEVQATAKRLTNLLIELLR